MNKKKKILYTKVIILVLCFFIIIRIFNLALSKYESISNSTADIDVAIYLLKEDYKKMALNLASLIPQKEEYVYTFSIGNTDGDNIAEVDLIYDLSIRTTTNLPLSYELYMNQNYTDNDAKSIITSNTTEKDEYGTYFRNIKTESIELKYTEPITNVYQLVVSFPKEYNSENYQDIIEMIEITVDGKQLIS